MTTIIDTPKTKAKKTTRLRLAAANAGAALAQPNRSPYEFQPGARQLVPMLAELKAMRQHLAEDWPTSNLHDLNLSVRFGHCTQADADQHQAERCRRIDLRVLEFDRAIAGIQALLDLGCPFRGPP